MNETERCPRCLGDGIKIVGWRWVPKANPNSSPIVVTCPECNGSGVLPRVPKEK